MIAHGFALSGVSQVIGRRDLSATKNLPGPEARGGVREHRGGCPQLRKEEALGAQFLRHEPTIMPDGAPRCNHHARAAPTRRARIPGCRKTVRRIMGLGILAGVAYAVWRAIASNALPRRRAGRRSRSRSRPAGARRHLALDRAGRVGACPAHHPVKAKLASGIFHVAGGANYARTQADRCYLSENAAEADGLRPRSGKGSLTADVHLPDLVVDRERHRRRRCRPARR